MFEAIIDFFSTILLPIVWQIIVILIIFIIGVRVVALARKVLKKALTKGNADKGVITFLDNLVKYGLYAFLLMILLNKFGVETTSIAAALASAGVAVGLALQGSLSNLAGGVLILLLHPFRVDDYIITGGMEGTVKEIQLFYTKLVTADNRVVVMPNGALSNGNIINVSEKDKRRLDITASISYDADLKLAKDVLKALLEECSYVMKEEVYDVFVSNLGSSSVDLNVRFWVKKDDYWTAKSYVTEEIKLRLDANHIEIPYNKLDVYLQK